MARKIQWVTFPVEATESTAWWKPQAACADADPAIFYPDSSDFGTLKAALKYCASCPVVEPCAAYGVRFEVYGVWGGMSARQRERARRANKRRAMLFGSEDLASLPDPA